MAKCDWVSARRARRCSVPHLAVVLFVTLLVVGLTPATASAYWDYQGNLNPGAAYGEGQAGTSGDWRIRLSRNNCNAVMEIRRRSDGAWLFIPAPNGCASSDYTAIYGLDVYNASHAINTGGSGVYVNVRIDATT
jgi:hypothetical protein